MPRLIDLNKPFSSMTYEEQMFHLRGLREARTIAEVNNPIPARKTRKKALDKAKANIKDMTPEQREALIAALQAGDS